MKGVEQTGTKRRGRLALVDRLIPADLREAEDSVWQSRLLILISFAGFIWGPIFAPLYFFVFGSAKAGVSLLCAGVGTLVVPLLLRRTESLPFATHALCSILFLIVIAVTLARGGYPVSGLMWSAAIPMLAMFLAGWRSALLWAVLVAVKFLALGLAIAYGYGPVGRMTSGQMLFLDVSGLVAFLALLLSIAVIYEQTRLQTLAVTAAAARVREGDLSSRAPAPARGEIGVLASTFNRMVEQLASDARQKLAAEKEREALISELEGKNQELGRFTYTVSHDLKSPLVTIKGFLGLLKIDLESGDKERVERDFQRISNATDKMAQLLDELLDLSRAGRAINTPRNVDLGELAEEIAQVVTERGETRRAEIDVAPDLPIVSGDPIRLREVLENLLENALKYMGSQEAPRVEIGVRREVPPEVDKRVDGQAVVYVRDNGGGIAPRYHEKIFELFDRLDLSVEGTGIGLAITRRIIEVHGGRIWVESEGEGRGSTFCFTLAPGGAGCSPAGGGPASITGT